MSYPATPGSGLTFASTTSGTGEHYPYLLSVGVTTSVTVSLVLSSGVTYAIGDYVGQNGIPITFPGMGRIPGGSGIILGANLIDTAMQIAPAELWLFDQPVTPSTDNLPWCLSSADLAKNIGVIPFAGYYSTTAGSVSPVPFQNIPYRCAAGTTALYGCTVTRGAPLYPTTNAPMIRLFPSQD